MPNQDTIPGELPAQQRRPMFRFDPTVSSGTLLQLASILVLAAGGWATYQSDKATAKLELEQVKTAAAADKASNKEALIEIKGDVKELQRTVNQTNQMLAVLNASQKGKE